MNRNDDTRIENARAMLAREQIAWLRGLWVPADEPETEDETEDETEKEEEE